MPEVPLLGSGLHHPDELHRVRAVELNRKWWAWRLRWAFAGEETPRVGQLVQSCTPARVVSH